MCVRVSNTSNRRPNNYRTTIRRTQHQIHCEIGSARQFTRMSACTYIILCTYINSICPLQCDYIIWIKVNGRRRDRTPPAPSSRNLTPVPLQIWNIIIFCTHFHAETSCIRALRNFRTWRRRPNGFFKIVTIPTREIS